MTQNPCSAPMRPVAMIGPPAESSGQLPTGADDDQIMREVVRVSPLPVLLLGVADRQILEVSDSLAVLFGGGRDQLLGRDVVEFTRERPARSRLSLLASGDVDGYRARSRSHRRVDGSQFLADVWVSAFTDDLPRSLAIAIVLPVEGRELDRELPGTPGSSDALVLGTVGGDWHIDRISADVEQVLGYPAVDLIGRAVSSVIHPDDLPSLLVALGHALQGPGGATVRLRGRDATGQWRMMRALITPFVGQTSPGFGFAFAASGLATSGAGHRMRELEDHLRRIAREVTATGFGAGLSAVPTAQEYPALWGLSGRQLEIVTGLLTGARVPMIARSLFLSESTVRNHLSAVYRKLGVHSQQELLIALGAIPAGDGNSVDFV